MTLDLLAIAPHPDDVELTCGGTLLKMADAGYRTGILDLTQGETGTRGTPEIRAREAARAAQILGAKVRLNAGMPDAHLSVRDDYKVAIAEYIRELQPRTVILPYWEGRHPDHYTASKLGYEACFIAGLKNYLRRGLRHRHAHLRSRHHQTVRPPPPRHPRLRIAVSSAKRCAPVEKSLPTARRARRPHEFHRAPLRPHDRSKIRRRIRRQGNLASRRRRQNARSIDIACRSENARARRK
jgi:bacillithiol biosynthesis deacetylase BshB1